ncbi:MAG: endonuclease III [Ruminococcaceae bacterium]|nr:endonuclease III [Oscillospiraceae bacterium]
MEAKEHAAKIVAALTQLYPEALCALEYQGDPWKLLVMARLSAQCTDARVNLVCRELFAVLPDMKAMADAPLATIESLIRSCGLYHTKAKDLKGMANELLSRFDGHIPDDIDTLLTLPGVGRKIANLMVGDLYGKPAIVTDTHCIRIGGRLGFYPETLKDPRKIETILAGLIEPGEQSDFCHRIVLFGRETCTARAPRCNTCPLSALCQKAENETRGQASKIKEDIS